MSAPQRAFTVEIKASADTLEDLVSLLEHFTEEIERGGRGCANGGPSSGGSYDVKLNPFMTHEKYIAALEKHLEDTKE